MTAWTAPFVVAGAVLAFSGVAKLRDPQPAAALLRATGVPAGHAAVRCGGGVEALLGVAAVWSGAPALAVSVAVAYLAFAALAARVVVGGLAVESCGCLGGADSPPGWTHVAFDVAAGAVALAAAVTGGAAVRDLTALALPGAVVALALMGVAVRLVWLVLADLPRLRRVGGA